MRAPVTQNHLNEPDNLMLQNAKPFSAIHALTEHVWMSGRDVSGMAPATRFFSSNASGLPSFPKLLQNQDVLAASIAHLFVSLASLYIDCLLPILCGFLLRAPLTDSFKDFRHCEKPSGRTTCAFETTVQLRNLVLSVA